MNRAFVARSSCTSIAIPVLFGSSSVVPTDVLHRRESLAPDEKCISHAYGSASAVSWCDLESVQHDI